MDTNKKKTRWFVVIINIVLGLCYLLPLYWTFITSIKDKSEIYSQPLTLFPHSFSISNYIGLFQSKNSAYIVYLLNSIKVDICTIILVTVICVLAGYAFSKLQLIGKNFWLTLILFTIMVPFQTLMIPLHDTMSSLGLLNSLPGLVLIYTTYQAPFCVYMMKSSFDMIPSALQEAATIDGAGNFQIFRRIYMPLAMPGIVTTVVYSAYTTWNDYLLALTFGGTSLKTFNVGLVDLAINEDVLEWGYMTAGSIISLVPIMILFLFLQKYFVEGMMRGAIK